MIFPADDNSTPIDHIPSRSQVACVLQCGGIWIGGKGWGLTWKLFQCVVKKNPQSVSLRGVCNVHIPPEDVESEQPVIQLQPQPQKPTAIALASVDDSQDDEPEPVSSPRASTSLKEVVVEVPLPEQEQEQETVKVAEPEQVVAKKVVKKVVKKST